MSSIDAAEQQVRDYIETEMGVDTSGAEIAIEKADPLKQNRRPAWKRTTPQPVATRAANDRGVVSRQSSLLDVLLLQERG